jgi:hypothetical protein
MDAEAGGNNAKRGMAVKVIAAMVCCGLCVTSLAWAEPEWRASVGVSEEYNDNVNEERHGEGDFVTSLKPLMGYRREGARTLLEADYRGAWNHYAADTRDQEFNHDARAHALFEAWRNFFFFDLNDTYRMVNLDTTRGEVIEGDSTLGQTQQNTFSFSSYITPRFGDRGVMKIGHAYSNIWYESGGETKNVHRGFADLTYELSPRTVLLSGYSYSRQLAGSGDLGRHVAYLGASYQYAENSRLFAKAGPQHTRYDESGTSSLSLFWDAGWTHDFGHVVLDVTTGLKSEDDPDSGDTYDKRFGTVRLTKQFQRTVLGVFTTVEEYEQESSDSVRRTYAGVNLSRELNSRLNGVLTLARDLQSSDVEDRTRWYGSLVFKYILAEDLAAEAWYRYKDVSNSEDDDDYAVHRIGVQLTKQF